MIISARHIHLPLDLAVHLAIEVGVEPDPGAEEYLHHDLFALGKRAVVGHEVLNWVRDYDRKPDFFLLCL